MKKYLVNFDDNDKPFELILNDADHADIKGVQYEYEYKFVNSNVLVLRMNNRNYFLDITNSDDDTSIIVNHNSKSYSLQCRSELDLILEKMNGNKKEVKLKNEIFSPMPGIIKKLNVSEGQAISKGDVVLVLEAMKMENEIKASRNCVIKKVVISELSSVEKNQLLLVIE